MFWVSSICFFSCFKLFFFPLFVYLLNCSPLPLHLSVVWSIFPFSSVFFSSLPFSLSYLSFVSTTSFSFSLKSHHHHATFMLQIILPFLIIFAPFLFTSSSHYTLTLVHTKLDILNKPNTRTKIKQNKVNHKKKILTEYEWTSNTFTLEESQHNCED